MEDPKQQKSSFKQFYSFRYPGNIGNPLVFDPRDVQDNRLWGIFAYIPVMWMIPLIVQQRRSPLINFHLNQGLGYAILNISVQVIKFFVGERYGWITPILEYLVYIPRLISCIYAMTGRGIFIPWIGKYFRFFRVF